MAVGWCSTIKTNDNFSKKIDCGNIYYSYYLDRINEENEYRKESGEYRMANFDLSETFITKFYYDWDYDDDSVVYSYSLPLWFFYSPTENTCILELESNRSDDNFGIRQYYKLWDMLTDTEVSYYWIQFIEWSWWVDYMWNKTNYEKYIKYLKWDMSKNVDFDLDLDLD